MTGKKPVDFWILLTTLVLLAMGTVMVFSSSSATAYANMNGDMYYFLKKQMLVMPIALAGMFVAMNIDYRKLAKFSTILLAVSILLLIAVLIPGIGQVVNDSRRWISIGIGGQGFQPSEIAKLAIILYFSSRLAKDRDKLKYFIKGLLPYLAILGLIAALLMKEPHMSGTIIIMIVGMSILFTAGARIGHFIMLSVPAAALAVFAVLSAEYRMNRVMSFLDPWKYKKDEGWQILNSLYAIGTGGFFGRGLGKSLQKFLYLPEPYNDFILSILAEELGFIGVFFVLLLFIIFIWRGIMIAMKAPDVLGSLIATGITVLIGIQVVVNVLVVTSSMPVTGMPLPFFSYGGTSLAILLFNVGILLNISRYANYERI